MILRPHLLRAAGLITGIALHPVSAEPLTVAPADARSIAKEAYMYGFPLVDNYRIMHSYFVDKDGKEFKTEWNKIHNDARVYTPEDKAIQTPNSDTPYSQLGTDLRAEPLVITVPAAEGGRYYSLQFIDLYTFNYAYVGSRATGSDAASFLLAGPSWNGEKPEGIKQVIRSETEIGWIQFRTQLFDPEDIEGVKKIQAGYQVSPLSAFLGKAPPPAAQEITFPKPLTPQEQRESLQFFELLNFLLKFCPTHPSETELMERFAKIGLGAESGLQVADLSPEMKEAFKAGVEDAWKEFDEFKRTKLDTGELTADSGYGTREFMKNNYLFRWASAALGIYGNSKEEAMYPAYYVDSEGKPMNGATGKYILRFPPGELPPVNSFWSLTMYGLPESLLVDNPLDRYVINSPMLDSLKRDKDGGLTIYIQNDSPGKERESNWLPAPEGNFWLVMRLYWPKETALNGTWKAPKVERVDDGSGASLPVNADNFARAESDLYMRSIVGRDALGKFDHNRVPTPVDDQTIIRMNRDTLYSAAVFDLDAGPATITLPDPGDRFLSMQVIDQDHYTRAVLYGHGTHTFTREDIGTRYVLCAVRILADPADENDLKVAQGLQDSIKVEQKSPGTFECPDWDMASQKLVRDALNTLASTLPDTRHMFGNKDEVQPVRHLIGCAMGWGGNPSKDALYLNVTPESNDGNTPYRLKVGKVPVDGFWSISVYNKDGYFEPNEAGAYTINSLTAKKDANGSATIHFGGSDEDADNYLPITPGWNYMVRLYRPNQEILDGSWKFPAAAPVK